MLQLATMQVSASRRIREPLAVIVVDVVDLATLNTRYGLGPVTACCGGSRTRYAPCSASRTLSDVGRATRC
jgi:hypothetical protein